MSPKFSPAVLLALGKRVLTGALSLDRLRLLKRIGDPVDIAKTVLFLVEGSDFITGQVVVVDGGQSIR